MVVDTKPTRFGIQAPFDVYDSDTLEDLVQKFVFLGGTGCSVSTRFAIHLPFLLLSASAPSDDRNIDQVLVSGVPVKFSKHDDITRN